MLFTRRSAAKHFPALRTKWLDNQPFVESMTISAEQSKLKFSKYEIEKGKNNPDPIEEEPDEFSGDSNTTDDPEDLMS